MKKVVYNRLIDFIKKHNSLFSHQYGFRSQHSTSLALIPLIDEISSSADNKEYCAGTFLDLSKAFDTVNLAVQKGTFLVANLSVLKIGKKGFARFYTY